MTLNAFPMSSSSTPASKLINEHNLTNIVNRLTNKDSFIAYYNESATDTSFIGFSIHGYYFECDSNTIGKNIYAWIIMDSSTVKPWEVISLTNNADGGLVMDITNDNNESVKSSSGLHLGTTKPNSIYYLQLFDSNDGTTRIIHEDSLIKFTTDSDTRSVKIDDGDLDE